MPTKTKVLYLDDIRKNLDELPGESNRCLNTEQVKYLHGLISKIDPSLEYVCRLGGNGGVDGIVFRVRKEKKDAVLKISKGIDLSLEAQCHINLAGVRGVPQLYHAYKSKDNEVIALLKEFAEGQTLAQYGNVGLDLYIALSQLEDRFQERGYLLPADIGPSNIIYNPKTRTTWVVDLGMAKRIEKATEHDYKMLHEQLRALKERFCK